LQNAMHLVPQAAVDDRRVLARVGSAIVGDNEADALALLLWATDAEGGRA
jgi:hypothetical protein